MDDLPDLFGFDGATAPLAKPPAQARRAAAIQVGAADVDARTTELAMRLDRRIWLGTSSWYFPGWAGSVFDRVYRKHDIVKSGLVAYAQHPLLRTVSLDRSFYRPIPASEYAVLAAQVPGDFRFIVKAWMGITDATLRVAGSGQPMQINPHFLDAALACTEVVTPAIEGLGDKLGALVFQLSPLTSEWLQDHDRWLERLAAFFRVLPRPAPGVLALEVRDAALLTPGLAAVLKAEGVRYCLGLHHRMPAIDAQLPLLRALWPGPLVCRWNLQRGLRYAQAKRLFEPFDKLAAPDPATRAELARIVAATAAAGHPAWVTINNKAEGSAPLSVDALAEEIDKQTVPHTP